WYWSTDFGGYVDATLESGGTSAGKSMKTVSAANYFLTVAPDAIATTFGAEMTDRPTSSSPVQRGEAQLRQLIRKYESSLPIFHSLHTSIANYRSRNHPLNQLFQFFPSVSRAWHGACAFVA